MPSSARKYLAGVTGPPELSGLKASEDGLKLTPAAVGLDVVAELAGLRAGFSLGDQRDLAVVERQAVAAVLAVDDLGRRHIGEGELVDLGWRRAAGEPLDAHAFDEFAGGGKSHHVGKSRLLWQGHVQRRELRFADGRRGLCGFKLDGFSRSKSKLEISNQPLC